ncbi:MAG: DUF87 domain-containing protein [Metallosphaera sp.]
MEVTLRYLIVLSITLIEVALIPYLIPTYLGQLSAFLIIPLALFINGVVFPFILESMFSSFAYALSIVTLLTLFNVSDLLAVTYYISGLGVAFLIMFLTRSLWERSTLTIRRLNRRPDSKIFLLTFVLSILVYWLTKSVFLVVGVIVDCVFSSFLGEFYLALLSSSSWILLPYLIIFEPKSYNVPSNQIYIGTIEKVLIKGVIPGIFQSGYRYKWVNERRKFYIDFNKMKNYNSVIIGSSGYGKSTLARTILSQIKIDYIVFDIHGEYSDIPGKKIDMSVNGLNPLSLFERSPKQRSTEIAMMLKSVFGLGNIQTMTISNLLIEAYQEKGIYDEDRTTWSLEPPTIRDLITLIQRKKVAAINSQDINQLKSIEPYLLFLDSNVFLGKEDIKDLLRGQVVLDFSKVTTSHIKYIIMESVLISIFNYMYNEKSNTLKRLIVIDEAPFLLEKESGERLAERLFAEGRKFGHGFIIISQYSKKLERIINNATLVMAMRLSEPDELSYISKIIGGRYINAERTIYESLSGLERGMMITRDITEDEVIIVRIDGR